MRASSYKIAFSVITITGSLITSTALQPSQEPVVLLEALNRPITLKLKDAKEHELFEKLATKSGIQIRMADPEVVSSRRLDIEFTRAPAFACFEMAASIGNRKTPNYQIGREGEGLVIRKHPSPNRVSANPVWEPALLDEMRVHPLFSDVTKFRSSNIANQNTTGQPPVPGAPANPGGLNPSAAPRRSGQPGQPGQPPQRGNPGGFSGSGFGGQDFGGPMPGQGRPGIGGQPSHTITRLSDTTMIFSENGVSERGEPGVWMTVYMVNNGELKRQKTTFHPFQSPRPRGGGPGIPGGPGGAPPRLPDPSAPRPPAGDGGDNKVDQPSELP